MRPHLRVSAVSLRAVLWGALWAALMPAWAQQVSVAISPTSVTLTHGQSQQFVAAVAGTSNTTVLWKLDPGGLGTLTTNGLYTAPASLFQDRTVTVTAVSAADSSKSASATVTLRATVAISLSPTSVTLLRGQSQQFTATVTGTSNTGVSWVMEPAVGVLTSTGLYTAPDSVSGSQTITLTATSAADPTKSATATITLSPGVSVSISPGSVTLGSSEKQQFTANVSGTTNRTVIWTLNVLVGSISTTGLYTAPASVTTRQTVQVIASSAADPSKSATATITLAPPAPVVDIGSGSPNPGVQQFFIDAYYRNGFNRLVSGAPLANVHTFGPAGYIQEFQDADKAKLALVYPNMPASAEQPPVLQVLPAMYAYYSSIGVNTAGYPTMDTETCGLIGGASLCQYQLFSTSYALFVYTSGTLAGQNFAVRSPIYARWSSLGGLSGLGLPVEAEQAVTSPAGTKATAQVFSNGAAYAHTSGLQNGKTFAVLQPLYGLLLAQGGVAGFLGLPVSDEITLSSGVHRQSFEGGALEYTPGSDPGVRLPVSSVAISAAGGTLRLNLGDTAAVSARTLASTGAELIGRTISWATSNGGVVKIVGSGASVTLQAVGGGSALITATSEGKVSPALSIFVSAPCCRVGEGAPTAAIQQAFQDAVTRNRLAILVPSPSPVRRTGSGYTQMLQAAAPGSDVRYLVTKLDRSPAAYVTAGDLLGRYEELGGPAGPLGYPVSDAAAGGHQLFENQAALAGIPPRVVSGPVLAKWAASGYESGPAGPPAGEAVNFLSFAATSGTQQMFANGAIYGAMSGPRRGQAFLVSGLILARYLELGGAGGLLGMPVSEEFAAGDQRRQNFEGGYVDYAAGDAAAREHEAERRPLMTAVPAVTAAGSRVRLALSGFPAASTLRVSVSGEPDFLVATRNGAYTWESYVPLGAPSGVVVVRAVDAAGEAAAEASYTVKAMAEARMRLVKVRGDAQAGPPGALLPQALKVALRDEAGNPVIGAPVVFQASPGAELSAASATTDENGEAETVLRLPAVEGVALATADAPGIAISPVTFSARAAAASLANYPKLMQAGSGPLLAAVASILRYHQSQGELPSPNGLADVAPLNDFLKNFCVVDGDGTRLCDGFLAVSPAGEQVVNLWRAGEFAGGGLDVTVEKPQAAAIRDLLAQGSPVLLVLSLSANGAQAGGHFVVATGIAADGGILIHDPNPDWARQALADYLGGFSAGGRSWKGELTGVARLVPRQPAATRFLLSAVSQPAVLLQALALRVTSAAGSCGPWLDLPDAVSPAQPQPSPLISRFLPCDGNRPVYQIEVGAAQPYRVGLTDLASGGGAMNLAGATPAVYRTVRAPLRLAVSPMSVSFEAGSVVSGVAGVAPGGLIALTGSGLAGGGSETVVEIGGTVAHVIATGSFQLTAEVPAEITPGISTVRVRSSFGAAERPVEIRTVAPAIFATGDRGAVANANSEINSARTPARRGEAITIYGTGFGAVSAQGTYSVVNAPVTILLNGIELPAMFAGLTPGYPGVYQVNVVLPASLPPGLDLPLQIRQGGEASNPVSFSVR